LDRSTAVYRVNRVRFPVGALSFSTIVAGDHMNLVHLKDPEPDIESEPDLLDGIASY